MNPRTEFFEHPLFAVVDANVDAEKIHHLAAQFEAMVQVVQETPGMLPTDIVSVPCETQLVLGMSLICQLGLAAMAARYGKDESREELAP